MLWKVEDGEGTHMAYIPVPYPYPRITWDPAPYLNIPSPESSAIWIKFLRDQRNYQEGGELNELMNTKSMDMYIFPILQSLILLESTLKASPTSCRFRHKKNLPCLMLQRQLILFKCQVVFYLFFNKKVKKKKKNIFSTAVPTQGYPLHCMGHKDTHQLQPGEAAFSASYF